jgi:HAD superfamily hydrolase (TIGR01509 family)
VLIDSEPIANRVLRDLLETVGLSMTLEKVMQTFIGRTRDGCLELASKMIGHPLPPRFGEEWDAALFKALGDEVPPVAGIPELLRSIELPFCVASNGNRDRMEHALAAAGLLPLVHGRLFTAQEVANPKPAPDLFLHAARSMGVAPAECVVIEDTPTGVKAGIAAGMKVFGYAGAPHADPDAMRALGAITFTDMRALMPMLERR